MILILKKSFSIKKVFILIISITFIGSSTKAQSLSYSCKFDLHLLSTQVAKGRNSEALMLSSDMILQQPCKHLSDSIFYLRAMAFYQKKMFDSAINNYNKVILPDTLALQSKIFCALNYTFINNPNKALQELNSLSAKNNLINELLLVQKAGNALLIRDYKQFASAREGFSYKQFTLTTEERKLGEAYEMLQSNYYKSPVKAAWLSVFIPGAGKWYARSRGKAVASFLTVAVLSSITAEQVSKRGWNHYASWATASATALFYAGNIYGSYYQAKDYNKNFENETDENIRYHMHVSLRNVYY